MVKIKSLTDEQIARFPEFVKKWTDIGLCTEPADRVQAEHGVRLAYQAANLKLPSKIVWTTSPLAQGLTRAIVLNSTTMASVRDSAGAPVRKSVRNFVWASVRDSVRDSVWGSVLASVRDSVWGSVLASVGDSVRDSVWESVRDSAGAPVRKSVRNFVWASVRDSVRDSVWGSVLASVGDSVRDSVWESVGESVGAPVGDSVRFSVMDSVGASVRDSVGASVRDSVGASVGAHVGDSVWESVRDSVGAPVGDSVRVSVRDSVLDSCYGQHDAGLVSIYDYMRLVLGLTNETSKLDGLTMLAKTSGWILPHEHICWISERHRRVCINSRGQLHSHDGMAVRYPDGWGVWAWNGVRVTEQIILNPSTITPDQIAKERNSQVRQVMVERIGIERVCQMFNAHSIDKQGNYELLVLNLGDGRKRPYLKMLNPSVGVWHVEGVHPNCRTVQESLNWRNGLSSDQIDDVNGADWIQQGDVILKPDGARKFKSRPIQLT